MAISAFELTAFLQGSAATVQGLETTDAVLLKGLVLLNQFSASLNLPCACFAHLYILCVWRAGPSSPRLLISLTAENRRPVLAPAAASFVTGRVSTVPLYIVLDAHSTTTLPFYSFPSWLLEPVSLCSSALVHAVKATPAPTTCRFHLCQHVLCTHLRSGRFVFPTTVFNPSTQSETTITWPTMATISHYRR